MLNGSPRRGSRSSFSFSFTGPFDGHLFCLCDWPFGPFFSGMTNQSPLDRPLVFPTIRVYICPLPFPNSSNRQIFGLAGFKPQLSLTLFPSFTISWDTSLPGQSHRLRLMPGKSCHRHYSRPFPLLSLFAEDVLSTSQPFFRDTIPQPLVRTKSFFT